MASDITTPLVSVVMPAHNAASTIMAAATSVLGQTFGDLELLIVDDRSSDDTAKACADLVARDTRVRVLRRDSRLGPARARNAALSEARGRFVAFCDSDDLWLPAKLERQLALHEETGAALIYSAYHRVDAQYAGSATNFRPEGRVVSVPSTLTHRQLLRRNIVGCLTAMVDLHQTGPVSMPDIPGAEDWALWLRILRDGGIAAGVTEPLALYRTAQPGSHSAHRWRAVAAVWGVLRHEEGMRVPAAALRLATSAASALVKARI